MEGAISMEFDKKKYIAITKGVIMYLTKDKYNLLSKVETEEESYYRFFTVNKTGKDIVMMINGFETIENLEKKFCEKYKLSFSENEEWLDEYLKMLLEKEAVILDNEPIEQDELRVAGDGSIISPMTATIEVTDKCNLRCKHCYLDASCERNNMITYEQFERLVEIFKKNHVLNLELTGGELFVNPDAYKILELAFKRFSTVAILTNGTIMNDEILELLARNKEKTAINVSLDSVRPEVHDAFRGMKGAFARTCNNIRKMTDAGLNVRIASSIFKENMWEIDKLADLSVELGAKMFVFNFVEDFGRGNLLEKADKVEERLDAIEYMQYVNEILERYKNIIPIVNRDNKILGSENCGSAVNSIVVGADGMIRPCALFPKMNIFGNIFEEDFKNIFERDIYRKVSAIVPPSEKAGCKKSCQYYVNCRGCYLKGLEKNRGKDDYCEWVKINHLEEMVKIYEKGFNECLA